MSSEETYAVMARWASLNKEFATSIIELAKEVYGFGGELVDGTPAIVIDMTPSYVFHTRIWDGMTWVREPLALPEKSWQLDFRFETDKSEGFVSDPYQCILSDIDAYVSFSKKVVSRAIEVYNINEEVIPGTESVSLNYAYDKPDMLMPCESYSHMARMRPVVVKWDLRIQFETRGFRKEED